MEDISKYYHKYRKAIEELEQLYLRGKENARYYRGQNWTAEDLTKHYDQGFYHAYSIPLIAVKLNRILSIQRDNRFDAKARGRGQEDELTAEVINYILKYVDDINMFKWVESEVFQDGLCKLYGVLKVTKDTTFNPLGEISLTKIPYDQFYYDTNAIRYNLEDAVFMGEYKWISMDNAKVLYPDFDFEKQGDTSVENYLTTSWSKQAQMDYSKMYHGYSEPKIVDWLDEKKRTVKICEHYEKEWTQKYLVKNFKTGDFLPFDSKKQADEYIMTQIQGEMKAASSQPNYSKIFTDEDFGVIPKYLPTWHKVLFTGTTLISKEVHPYYTPPYFRYCALFDDGKFWTLTDLAKDPQKAYDRMMSMIDKSTAKNIKGNNYTVIPARLHPTETQDMTALGNDLTSGGKLIRAVAHDAIAPINKFNDIRVESGLATTYQSLIEDLLGGRSFQGLDSPVRQTATEVISLERNASQTGLLFSDNLARWKQSVFTYVVELIKDIYTPERTIRIIGEVSSKKIQDTFTSKGIYTPSELYQGEVGYLNLSKLPKPIDQCELDIVIDNVANGKLDKDEKFQQIMALNQISINAGYPPIPYTLLLQYSKLDPTIKNELEEYQKKAEEEMAKQKQMSTDLAEVNALKSMGELVKPQKSKSDADGDETQQSNSQNNKIIM